MAKNYQDLRKKMSLDSQRNARRLAKEMKKEMVLYELRLARHFSQQKMAKILKTSQANVSKLEKRADMYISTLNEYIHAVGGELKIIACFPEGEVTIAQFNEI